MSCGGILEETEDCPVKTTVETFDGLNLDTPVNIVLTKFSNKTQLLVTETNKTSVFYQVSRIGETHPTFETICLLGVESEESLVTARIIGEQLDIKIPLVIAFGFQDSKAALKPAHIGPLVDFIKSFFNQNE